MLRAAFAEADITPPLGTQKIGWLREIRSESVLDPLFVRVAALESGGAVLVFVQLDTLCIRWTQVAAIRSRVQARWGVPPEHLLVNASHNHAGPAVANCGGVPRDEAYLATLTERVVATVGRALDGLAPATLGLGHTYEWRLAHNRRVVRRDGTVRTHGTFAGDPLSLCLEGPVDPEVAVLAVRGADGNLRGALVNFACHPTHHGGDTVLSAGYPGALAREMQARGCPVTLFLNGPCGNVHHADPTGLTGDHTQEQMGAILAEDASRVIAGLSFRGEPRLSGRSTTLQLPFRELADDQVRGTAHGAQRFGAAGVYDLTMPDLLAKVRRLGTQPAEVQVLRLDDWAVAAIPAEYFVEFGLRIKEESSPTRALVVSCANGMVGYVPTREAFRRGGYETTFGEVSHLAAEAGDQVADAAIALCQA